MAKLSTADLLDAFKEMTLIELSEFVKEFETTFDVTAAAPVMAGVAMPGAGAAPAEQEEEKDEFDVVLESDGGKKIQVIKVVRELTGLGLKEAKDAVESAPKAILEKANKETAEKAKAKLEEQGAKVTLKSGRSTPPATAVRPDGHPGTMPGWPFSSFGTWPCRVQPGGVGYPPRGSTVRQRHRTLRRVPRSAGRLSRSAVCVPGRRRTVTGPGISRIAGAFLGLMAIMSPVAPAVRHAGGGSALDATGPSRAR